MATRSPSRILLPALSCALTLCALAGPPSATAQRLAPATFMNVARPSTSLPGPPRADSPPSAGRVILGGALGSAAGLVAGAGMGYGLGGEEGDLLGGLAGSVVGSALGSRLAARYQGRAPTFGAAVKGGLLGSLAGLAGAAIGGPIDPWAGLVGFSLAQGTVAGLWARSHTPR